MTMLIELDTNNKVNNLPAILVNGKSLEGKSLKILPNPKTPFTRIFIDNEPQFDVEVWIDGSLVHLVPKKSYWSEAIYRILESPAEAKIRNSNELRQETIQEMRRKVMEKKSLVLTDANFDDWDNLKRINALWTQNGLALIDLLEKLEQDEELAFEMVQNVHSTEVRDSVALQLDRHIFNYLSSMSTMIDVTRNLLKHYEGSEFSRRYKKQVSEITDNASFVFVKDLRNYNLHYALPIGGHSVSWNSSEEGIKSVVTANRDVLLRWKRWTPSARKYLQEMSETVELTNILKSHYARFFVFWRWILQQRNGLHSLEFFIHDQLAKEANWMLSFGSVEEPRSEWLIPFKYQDNLEQWYEL